ncbi:MAG: hypothetical protein R6V33_05855 [Pelovirga sp.]
MKYFFLLILLSLVLLLGACGGSEKYGDGVDPNVQKVQVSDVFFNEELLGRQVTLEGKIVSQCDSNGCWFFLQDDTGQIFIDLSRHGFELPSLPGRSVAATGVVARSQQAFLLIASGVEVK